MKKFLVVLLACVMIFGFATTALAADTQIKEFSDIADQPQAAKNAIMKLAILGVVEGNEGIGGSFRPADNLTRAEFAKIVCYLTDNVKVAESLASVGTKFSDVTTGNWYTGWVNAAAQSGYFLGDPGGTFRPNANITMQEVVTVALRCAGYNEKLGSATGNTTWPANYVSKAMSIGILDDVTFVGSAAATRADMSIICNEVLGINMVVHINNDIAYALALSDGTVDPDGFSEVYYISNETKRNKIEETILHKAFDGQYYYLQVNQTEMRDGDITESLAQYFDESNGWSYEDYDDGEIYLNLTNAHCYEDDDFDEFVYRTDDSDNLYEYGVAESLASTYYITGDNGLADLSGMQVQIIVIDGKEINYVNVYSSYVLAKSVYKNSNSNIVADGKTYRASSTMDVGAKVNDGVAPTKNGRLTGVIDLTEESTFDGDAIQHLYNSSSDDDFPGKVYLDKDGRVYAVKNYNAYNQLPFGIVEEIDNEVVLKAQTTGWKTSGSTGSTTNYTLDTDEPYVLYKDGELVKADDLAENDVITYLGDNGGHFYYVTSPAEGELTQQTSSKLTVTGYGYRLTNGFHLSDDGGDSFDPYAYGASNPIDTASFGEVEFATAYNFSRVDYVALNTSANKVIGVVTNADPDSVYNSGGTTFNPQFKKLTIYNAEGKEVTYTFTTNFRNAYNRMLAETGRVPNAEFSSSSSARWGSEYWNSDTTKRLEDLPDGREIQEGDIVQLTLDKSDNIKKVTNYVAFDGKADSDKVEATVKTSNNRITIQKNTLAKENGTYTLPSDATIFNVTVDGGDYDDVDLKTVASTLSADFKAMKIVAFDTKNNGNINVLYILEGVSAYKFGIVSGQGRDATDDYYTINGSRVYGGERDARTPSLISYQISGGDAEITGKGFNGYLAWVGNGTTTGDKGVVYYLSDMGALVKKMDSDYGAAVGEVKSYSSSTNALNVDGTLVYITSDTFLYDFPADDDLSSAASLRDKFVAVIYDDDFDAVAVALLSEKDSDGTWKKLSGHDSGTGFASKTDALTTTAGDLNLVDIVSAVSDTTSVVTARINADGDIELTSVAEGTATITVRDSNGDAATITVTVSSIGNISTTVVPYFATVAIPVLGNTDLGLAAPFITATSSDTGVATVAIDQSTGDKITITAKGSGTATITVTNGLGQAAKVIVTVDATGASTTQIIPPGVIINYADLGAITEADADFEVGGTVTDDPEIAANYRYLVGGTGWDPALVGSGSDEFDVDDEATFEIVLTAQAGFTFAGTDITKAKLATDFDEADDVDVTVSTNVTVGDTLTIVLTYELDPIAITGIDSGFVDTYSPGSNLGLTSVADFDAVLPAAVDLEHAGGTVTIDITGWTCASYDKTDMTNPQVFTATLDSADLVGYDIGSIVVIVTVTLDYAQN